MRRLAPWLWGWAGALMGCAALLPLLIGRWDLALAQHLLGATGLAVAVRLWRIQAPATSDLSPAPLQEKSLHHLLGDPFAVTLAALVPGLGPAAAWLHILASRRLSRGSVLEDYADYLDATSQVGQAMTERAQAEPIPEQLAPLADVLQSDASDDFKRSAIENLARMETPEAITVLRRTLSHDSVEVRFYAAGALEHLERRLAGRLAALERQLATTGGDSVLFLNLAQACFDYSYYHVATDQRRHQVLERALTFARQAGEAGGDPQTWILAGRSLLELQRFPEAESCFRRYLDIHGEDVKGLLWHAEALFRQGRYQGVRATCTKARHLGQVPRPLEAAVWMWA